MTPAGTPGVQIRERQRQKRSPAAVLEGSGPTDIIFARVRVTTKEYYMEKLKEMGHQTLGDFVRAAVKYYVAHEG